MFLSGLDPGSLIMALKGFSALLFVPTAPEVFAEIKTVILHCLLQTHSQISAFTKCHLK